MIRQGVKLNVEIKEEGFKDIKVEIQVRTFSQHVWAASSHLLQYKKEINVPAAMRRGIYRLAAVLEIVDNELESILDFREDYQNRLRVASKDEKCSLYFGQQLDSSMLEVVLNKYFPCENKRDNEPYGLMLKELFDAGIKTCGQLEQLLSAQEGYINKKEQERIDEHNHPFYSYLGLLRIALSRDKLTK